MPAPFDEGLAVDFVNFQIKTVIVLYMECFLTGFAGTSFCLKDWIGLDQDLGLDHFVVISLCPFVHFHAPVILNLKVCENK